MRIRPLSDPRELGAAWSGQYGRLAELFSRMLPKQRGVLVEIGCGKGQLTIPLAERLPRCQIIGVDRFRGSYSQAQTELLSDLASLGKNLAIKVIVSDYRAWLCNQQNSKYDAIISSEFLPEIDSKSMRGFFVESYPPNHGTRDKDDSSRLIATRDGPRLLQRNGFPHLQGRF